MNNEFQSEGIVQLIAPYIKRSNKLKELIQRIKEEGLLPLWLEEELTDAGLHPLWQKLNIQVTSNIMPIIYEAAKEIELTIRQLIEGYEIE